MVQAMDAPISKSLEDLVESTLKMYEGVGEIEEINDIEEVEEVVYSNGFLWQQGSQVIINIQKITTL
jgi:hypothetical protein